MFFNYHKNQIYQKELTSIRKKYISLKEISNIMHKRKSIKYIIKQIILLNIKELKAIFIIINIKHYKKRYNQKYYLTKLRDNKDLFDNVLGYPLDIEQRKAIINDEEHLLILAGAGSGKTLTMIGKVLYLLNQGIKANEILVISFTNASVKNFINKIKKYTTNIDVFTFHKLSLNIIKNKDIKVRILKDNLLDIIMCKYNINSQNKKVIESFIHLFKSKNLPFSMFDLYLNQTSKNKEKNQFIKIIKKIYFEYNDFLVKKQLIDFDENAFIHALKLFIVVALLVILYGLIFSGFQIVDEFEHLHASWLVSEGLFPYRDFFEHHHPLIWYIFAPIVSFFYNDVIVIFAVSFCSSQSI